MEEDIPCYNKGRSLPSQALAGLYSTVNQLNVLCFSIVFALPASYDQFKSSWMERTGCWRCFCVCGGEGGGRGGGGETERKEGTPLM